MIKLKIWGEINSKTSYIVEQAISDIDNDEETILIVINSVGGLIGDAIAITNLLKAVKNPIITVTIGNCMSAAAMIFALGTKRYVGNDISYLLHQPYFMRRRN